MKKAFSLTLAALMLLGCMSLSAFAAENENQSVLTLTAEVPSQKLSYKMVIPESVETVTAAGIHPIGAPSVEKVENGSMATVISYTASGTNFKSEGKAEIPATYYTDELGKNELDPQTPIKVYECNGPVDSLTNLYVGITAADWNAAEEGTYTAAVTFNFEESAAVTKTLGDILATIDNLPSSNDFQSAPRNAWVSEDGSVCFKLNEDGAVKLHFKFAESVHMVTGDWLGAYGRSSDNVFALSDGNWVCRNYDNHAEYGLRCGYTKFIVEDGTITQIVEKDLFSDTAVTFKPATN